MVLLANVPLLGDWNSTEGAFAFFTSEEEATHYHDHHLGDGRNRMLFGPGAPDDPHEAMASLRPRPVQDLRARLAELADINPLAAWCVNPDGHRENSAYGRLSYGGPHPSLDSVELDDDITESEAEDLVAEHLDATGLEESWEQLGQVELRPGDRLNQFHFVCWDAVTGNWADWQFPGFSAALRYLATYEREHDRQHRVAGAVSCGYIGFSGSGDAQSEDLRSARFRLGLRRLALRVFRRGYRPTDSGDLVALCNGLLSTLHVDYAGHAKDLLWASSSEQAAELLDALDIGEDVWRQWAESADVAVDDKCAADAVDGKGDTRRNIWHGEEALHVLSRCDEVNIRLAAHRGEVGARELGAYR